MRTFLFLESATNIIPQLVAMTKFFAEQSSQPTETRQPKVRSGAESGSRAHSAGYSTGATAGTNRDASHLKRLGPSSRDNHEPHDAVDALIASKEASLQKREKELKEERAENANLLRENHKLHKDVNAQAKAADAQAEELKLKKDKVKLLDNILAGIVTKALNPYAKASGITIPGQWSGTVVVSTLQLMSRDAMEVQSLRTQVESLQDEMLAKVEKVQAMSDDSLARDFRILVSLVKALSRTTQPKEEDNIVARFPPCLLTQHVDPHQWFSRAQKKLYIEAWFWCILVHFVFRQPFTLFGTEGIEYNKMYARLFGEQLPHGWPVPTHLSETWRYTTVDQLAGFIGHEVLTCWEAKKHHGYLDKTVLEVRGKAFETFERVLTSFSPSTDHAAVRQIIDKAFALALQMYLQRFRLMITWPAIGDCFDDSRMATIPNVNGEDIEDGVVAFVVNPGLTKYGDAHGKCLDERYDIVPSLVQLDPVDVGRPTKQANPEVRESGR